MYAHTGHASSQRVRYRSLELSRGSCTSNAHFSEPARRVAFHFVVQGARRRARVSSARGVPTKACKPAPAERKEGPAPRMLHFVSYALASALYIYLHAQIRGKRDRAREFLLFSVEYSRHRRFLCETGDADGSSSGREIYGRVQALCFSDICGNYNAFAVSPAVVEEIARVRYF